MPVQPSSLRRIKTLDARVEALRAEARTGLASSDVRRTLIKEELRPAPRIIPAPPQPSSSRVNISQNGTTRSTLAGTGERQHSLNVETNNGGDDEFIPASWLVGDIDLSAEESSLPTAPTTQASPATLGSGNAKSHVTYVDAARAYEALCAAAQGVVYDVQYEESLRNVESRDGRTGIATSWTARRTSAPLVSSTTAMLHRKVFAQPSTAMPEEGEEHLNLHDTVAKGMSQGPRSRQHTTNAPALADFYTPPPSRGSVASSSTTSRTTITSRRSSRAAASASTNSNAVRTSTVGTAVVCNTAARYATALRQRVQAQRQSSAATASPQRLTSTLRASGSPRGTFVKEEEDVREWRTRVAAARTILVCPSCDAMFEYTLDTPNDAENDRSSNGGSKEGINAAETDERSQAGTAGPSVTPGALSHSSTPPLPTTAVCSRCGHGVPVSISASHAPSVLQRWMLAPPPPQSSSSSSPPPPPQAQKATASSGNAEGVEHASTTTTTERSRSAAPLTKSVSGGCGTDSVGFADKDGEESFATLIARIRAAKKMAAGEASPASTSTGTDTAQGKAAKMCTGGDDAKTGSSSVGVGSESAAVGRVPTAVMAAVSAPASDPMVARLRSALSHLYFFELLQGSTRSSTTH